MTVTASYMKIHALGTRRGEPYPFFLSLSWRPHVPEQTSDSRAAAVMDSPLAAANLARNARTVQLWIGEVFPMSIYRCLGGSQSPSYRPLCAGVVQHKGTPVIKLRVPGEEVRFGRNQAS